MRCGAPFCKITSNDGDGDASTKSTGISFHAFPSEVGLRAAWLRALGKQDSHLPDSAVVCSQHFLDDEICETESGSRQLATGAVPSTVQVCMICLHTDSRLFLISKHKMEEAYEKLTGYPPYDVGNLKQTLCIQCAQRLRTFSQFRDKSLRARAIMMKLVEKYEFITRQHIKMINRTNYQLDNNLVVTTLGPDPCDLYIHEHPKAVEQQTNSEATLLTVEVKNEGSYDSMLVDEDMAVENDDSNAEYVNDEFVASNEEYLNEAKDPLKYESALFQCCLCYEQFESEPVYERHMHMHGQADAGDSKPAASPAYEAHTAASSSCPDTSLSLRAQHGMPPAKSRGHMLVNLVKKNNIPNTAESLPLLSETTKFIRDDDQNIMSCPEGNDSTKQTLPKDTLPVSPNIEIRSEELGIRDEVSICPDIEDPDYLLRRNSDECNDSQEITAKKNGRPTRGRKRKYADQNRTIRKKKANTNLEYISANGKIISAKEFKGNNFDCKCPRKCTEKISVEQRKKEFEKFWSSGSYEARCAILQENVTQNKKLRSYSVNSKRVFTRKYNLAGVQICKKTFLNTFAVSQTRIDFALKKLAEQAINDKRGVSSGGKNRTSLEKEEQISNFIERLPQDTSHLCRKDTTAKFLAPNLNLPRVYNLYREAYENPVSFSKFRQCFCEKFNVSIKKPQKDTCSRCDRYKASKTGATSTEKAALLEKEHKEHLEHAYKLRDLMKRDLARAKTDAFFETLTFDLGKTHCLPRLPTSIAYYKRQLNLYNLGIHCGSNGKSFFYIWLEHEAGRGSQEVGSCLQKFISENLKPEATQLILWADSCGGQHRSIKMMLMLLHILQNHTTLETITIRFLQSGHTNLPNDSEFEDVECALKAQIRLYTVADYIQVMENCRRHNQFIVTRLSKEDFRSVAPLQDRIRNRKMDTDKQNISWLTAFEITLLKNEPCKLFMKSNLENDAKVIDISKGKNRNSKANIFMTELPLLYPNGRELSAAKIMDLQEIIKLIPAHARPFYSFLKNVGSNDFMDDTEGFGNSVDYEIEINWEEIED